MISVLILTRNEEINLPDCLESVAWSDDVVVFDSYSTDSTTVVAEERDVRVVRRAFDGYASQRNAALSEVKYRNPWVLMIDADERVTPELRQELESTIPGLSEEVTLLRLRRKDMFLGRWLRRSTGYPTWFGRVVRPGRVRVEREINEEYHTDGAVDYLDEHLIHLPFNKGMEHWLSRHVSYARLEAQALKGEMSAGLGFRALFSGDPVTRRKAAKQIAYRMPFRPTLVFVYLYVVRGGVLDGRPGYLYCRMRAAYELMIDFFMAESTN